ncbi:hypothetical protein [Tenacibaculum finnmarkense]|uniref:hypothetical protein n=1 Tax=Tenacibaculum finnmarkense TaxID=2781243 RepID=UPI001EFC0180|nr:hypothetical protein [Tenacibaculum finnmarkense]MCG8859996.1 hypothetical protein [Tenacibaculum finnmarkense]
MIKFFRKIRQNLLSEGKTGKYFKYAIGEIVLVMVGILLALQVSNWNKNRQDRVSEQKLLNSIHKDFLENKKQFDITKSIHQTHFSSLEKILSLLPINGNKVSADSIAYYESLIKSNTFTPYSSTVDLIVNSNSIQLIENDTLKGYLVSWKNVSIEYLEEEEYYYKLLNELYFPFIIESFDLLNLNPLEMYSLKEYQNFVFMRRAYVRLIINAIEEEPIENSIDEIIRLTNQKK